MEGKAIEKLYHLKEQGVEHLKAGHFLHSSVYFKDVLDKFTKIHFVTAVRNDKIKNDKDKIK